RFVQKRDGSLQPWSIKKIERAIFGAFNEVQPDAVPNVADIARRVEEMAFADGESTLSIESAHSMVVVALDDLQHHEVAEAYVRYKDKRDELRARRLVPDREAVANYIHASKYAKHRKDLSRRETYSETVDRSLNMHLNKFAPTYEATSSEFREDIEFAFKAIYDKRVLPSMRSMQFGGEAIERNNCRMYNCSYTLINRLRVFGEI